MVGGEPIVLSMRNGMTLTNVATETTDDGVRLVFTFEHASLRLFRIARAYACYPGSPTIETWTNISCLRLAQRSSDQRRRMADRECRRNRELAWRPSARCRSRRAPVFELTGRELEPNQPWEIGSTGRSAGKITFHWSWSTMRLMWGFYGGRDVVGRLENPRRTKSNKIGFGMTALVQDLPDGRAGSPRSTTSHTCSFGLDLARKTAS